MFLKKLAETEKDGREMRIPGTGLKTCPGVSS